jgi:hypothetical protein
MATFLGVVSGAGAVYIDEMRVKLEPAARPLLHRRCTYIGHIGIGM